MNKVITIAQIVGTFSRGGAEKMALNSVIALQHTKFRSLGIAIHSQGVYTAKLPKSIKICLLKTEQWKTLNPLSLILKLQQVLSDECVDVLHVHGQRSLIIAVIALATLQNRPKLWFTWHDPERLRKKLWHNYVMVFALNFCNHILAPSHEIAEDLNSQKIFLGKARFFANAVEDISKSTAVIASKPTILWMARIVPTKQPEMAIRLASYLKHAGFEFKMILAGNPIEQAYFDFCKKLCCDLHVQDVVEMSGWIDEPEKLIQCCSIFLQTSNAEGLSMVLLEAMMAGLAIIASDVGSTSFAIKDKETGLLVPPKNEKAFLEALQLLLQDSNLRIQLGKNARKKAMEKFSLENLGKRLEEEYQDLGYF